LVFKDRVACFNRDLLLLSLRFQLPSRRQRGASSISSSRPLSTPQLQLFSFQLPANSSAAQWLPLSFSGGAPSITAALQINLFG
ncbi:hypothetical protein LZ198_35000, partial [Myxococcus sp. K15C18031901]|uniref:hypothetical protein n=1 Tax=Myxococcus dinghuensis TaxID=2906761 RepID=UPI0020A8366C